MLHDKDLHFLQERIYDLGSAIFSSTSEAILKLPTSIISLIKMDEIAQLWFFVPRPKQYINEFEKDFYAKLDFFKKGKDFYLKIEGKAYIVTDPEEINGLTDFSGDLKSKALQECILVKVRILKVDYFESRRSSTINWPERIKEQVNELLFKQRPGYRPYKFYPDTLAY